MAQERNRLLVFVDTLGNAEALIKPAFEAAKLVGWLAMPFTDEKLAIEELAPSISAVAATLSEKAVDIGMGHQLVTRSGQLSIPTAVVSARFAVDEWIRPESLDISIDRNPISELPYRIAGWLIRINSKL